MIQIVWTKGLKPSEVKAEVDRALEMGAVKLVKEDGRVAEILSQEDFDRSFLQMLGFYEMRWDELMRDLHRSLRRFRDALYDATGAYIDLHFDATTGEIEAEFGAAVRRFKADHDGIGELVEWARSVQSSLWA